jgi:hypothetical protein
MAATLVTTMTSSSALRPSFVPGAAPFQDDYAAAAAVAATIS